MIKEFFRSMIKIFVPPATRWLPRSYFGLRYLNPKLFNSDSVILDAGCGYGSVAVKLAKNKIQVIGVDVLESKVLTARQLARKAGVDRKAEFMVGSMTNLVFPNNFFDAAISLDAIEFVEDDKKAFEELARVLKPSGRLIVSVLHKNLEFEDENFSPEQKLLRKLVPEILRTKKQPYHGKNWLIATAQDKMIQDGRLRNYTVEDIGLKASPWFEVVRSQYIIKRFSRLAMDVTYSIKGAEFFKPFIFPLSMAMDRAFCQKNHGFAFIIEMKKNNV